MTIFGCTGHQFLTESTKTKVALEILQLIRDRNNGEIVGVSSLAEGADQLFSFTILAAGGVIDVINPSAGYESAFPTVKSEQNYRQLCKLARSITTLPHDKPSEEAFLAAGHEVTEKANEIIAVWDGKTAVGIGGTGDIVRYANEQGKKVHVIWPAGAARISH